MMILTGGPGTGKTTVVKALIQIYRTLYPEDAISLVAPQKKKAAKKDFKWNSNSLMFVRFIENLNGIYKKFICDESK